MSDQHVIEIVSSIFSGVLAIIWYLVKRLIRDIDKKLDESHLEVARTQQLADEKIKEKMFDFSKVADLLRGEVRSMEKSIALLEKNTEVINVMVKNADENLKDKVATFAKNADQINQMVQKLAVVEKEVDNFGKVIRK